MKQISSADANPSRAFFVRMLTRDISVTDCILDLMDNSVDSAWKKLGSEPLTLSGGPDFSSVRISLSFNDQHFSISDNCGGMTQASAEKHALTFGRKSEDPDDTGEFSIGVYGIGLKRAVFKIGSRINIRSTYFESQKKRSFSVPINVEQWVKDPSHEWDFPIMEASDLEDAGVEIQVEGLTYLAEATFRDPEFEGELVRTIARDYALHMNRGLQVYVNGERVQGEVFKLFSSDSFKPQFIHLTEEVDGKKIEIEIVAGLAFPPPDSNDPSEKKEREEKSGWYVACNGRIVMAADKSSLTVWGDDFPAWHHQYTGFFGLIVFTTDHTELLPLTTTKRSVDLSAIVYRRARPKMKDPTRSWIDYTNARKSDQAAAEQIEKTAYRQSIFQVQPQERMTLPVIKKTGPKETTIQFPMLQSRIKDLGSAFGNSRMSAREVGMRAFDYSYDELVGE